MNKTKKISQGAVALAPARSPTMPLTSVTQMQPKSAEQYWAARALSAETLLAAQLKHERDLRGQAWANETKRAKELAEITRISEEKQARLERLVLILLTCLCSFAALVIYLLHRSNERASRSQKYWSGFASHFTIPILSPFTSVVEQETSVVGTKSILFFITAAACLAYAVFRRMHPGG